jgi:hypothetical protein
MWKLVLFRRPNHPGDTLRLHAAGALDGIVQSEVWRRRCFDMVRPLAAVSKNRAGSNRRLPLAILVFMLDSPISAPFQPGIRAQFEAANLYKIAHFGQESQVHPTRASCG